MIYRCAFRDIDGVRYLTGYRLVSEHGRPAEDDELPAAPGPVLTEDGRYRWRLVANPDFGNDGDNRLYLLKDNPQPAPPVDEAEEARKARRMAVAAALPDILLAVADGADLAGEVKRVISTVEEATATDGQR